MTDIKLCRNCKHWIPIASWQGRCKKYQWLKPRWSKTAEAGQCADYKVKSTPKRGKQPK